MAFVCAFRGRRDAYQVPIALFEADELDLFITDAFSTERLIRSVGLVSGRAAGKLAQRYDARLPSNKVKRLWPLALSEYLMRKRGVSAETIYSSCDAVYTERAKERARATRSDLFLYSSHAWEAVRAMYPHDPRKIVFQFHPHFAAEERILREDADAFRRGGLGEIRSSDTPTVPDSGRWRCDEAWRYADHVVCASSFTKSTLVEAGADPTRISTVPYGIDIPPDLPATDAPGDRFHVLFVGTGFQRKGLHLLVSAWGKARSPEGSRLTIVSRAVDAEIAALIGRTRGVEVLTGVPSGDLPGLYRSATLFAMPSLVEGFGQVYLEALSHGLPVLGTRNTCLPDLGDENDGILLVSPGSLDELVWRLETLAHDLLGNDAVRRRAQACAARFPWSRFRSDIRAAATRGA